MPEPVTLLFSDIAVGQAARFSVLVDEEMVKRFADLSGDHNPLHVDEAYASETPFEGPIAHGMLLASFFSHLVGMHLPGRYAVYLSQKLLFRKPCRAGIEVLVSGEVIAKTESVQTITLRTIIEDARSSECLVEGEALVKLLK